MELNELYTQIVTENSRATHHRHAVEGATCAKEGVNPSCGDDITLQIKVRDGVVEDAGFAGSGCAISQASTSMMLDLIKGKPVAEAKRLVRLFLDMATGKVKGGDLDELEDCAALEGVAHMPARVKCAVLPWHTLEEELEESK